MRKAFLKRFKVLTTSAMMLTAALAFTGCAGSSSEKETTAATKESAENTTAATKETEAPATTAAEETTAAAETTAEPETTAAVDNGTTAAAEDETTAAVDNGTTAAAEDETTAAEEDETTTEAGSEDQGDAIVIGEGSTNFGFSVTFADGSEKSYSVYTDEENVGAALLGVELIAGEDSAYGLYVKTVDGQEADYDKDGHYWAFYIDGEYAMTGVDSTPIEDGKTYAFKYE